MKTISPVVITSKRAKNELENIKAQHAEILANLETHKAKVAEYNANKLAMEQQKRQEQMAQEDRKTTTEQKSRELDIKTKALSS